MNEEQTPEENKQPPIIKPVLEWAADKGTKRWLLCLAASAAGWLPEQVDDAVLALWAAASQPCQQGPTSGTVGS